LGRCLRLVGGGSLPSIWRGVHSRAVAVDLARQTLRHEKQLPPLIWRCYHFGTFCPSGG